MPSTFVSESWSSDPFLRQGSKSGKETQGIYMGRCRPNQVNPFFFALPDGNKTPAEQQGKRIQLGDVTQNPSAAQWREARYNGGRDPKSIFPNLQTRCHVGTFETDSSSQAKEGRRRTNTALLIQTDSEPVSNEVKEEG